MNNSQHTAFRAIVLFILGRKNVVLGKISALIIWCHKYNNNMKKIQRKAVPITIYLNIYPIMIYQSENNVTLSVMLPIYHHFSTSLFI